MKIKHTILLLLLADLSFAQINTNQKITEKSTSSAFLDASENGENFAPDVGRGLLFPQTDLSKFNLDIDAADGINYPTYFDGMIVYNTHEGGKTNDPGLKTQTENLTKGFYYFSNPKGKDNGNISEGRWIKLGSGSGANDGYWAQRDNGGVTETYLKPANTNGDFLGYLNDKKYTLRLGNVEESEFNYQQEKEGKSYLFNEVPKKVVITADAFPSKLSSSSTYSFFTQDAFLLKGPKVKNDKNYVGKEMRIVAKDLTSDIKDIYGSNSSVDFFTNSYVQSIYGIAGTTSVGSENSKYSRARATNNIAGVFTARNYGTSDFLYGIKAHVRNYGETSHIRGVQSVVNTYSGKDEKPHSLNFAAAYHGVLNIGKNATITGGQNGTNGLRLEYISKGNVTNRVHFGILNMAKLAEGDNMERLIGYHLDYTDIPDTAEIGAMYGLYMHDINKGTEKNYAIYTGLGKVRFGDSVGIGVDAPTEKLEVAGAVKLSATKNDCTQANRGTIKFENDNFYGCKSTGWVKLNP